MKSTFAQVSALLLVACAAQLTLSVVSASPPGALPPRRAKKTVFRAGAAARVVNPRRPAVTIGHRILTRFTNVYQDIRVQALAVEDRPGHPVCWLGMDFCIVEKRVVDEIKRRVEERYGLAPAALCVNSSHTHSAPPLTAEQAPEPSAFDAAYAREVIENAVLAVGDALRALQPARLRYAEDSCLIAINRRLKGKDGRVTMAPNPEGIVDKRTRVLVAESLDGRKLIGLLVVYAAHPVTVIGQGLGSDYPGYMRSFVEKKHPGCVVVFLQGCTGNIRIRVVTKDLKGWYRGTPETARCRSASR